MVASLPTDATRESLEMLATARCILAVATDSKTEFSVIAIAEATGLTVEAVRQVLESQLYQRLFEREASRLITHSLVQGMRAMNEILHDPSARRNEKVAAFRANAMAYQVIYNRTPPAKPSDDIDVERFTEKFITVEPKGAAT